MKYDKEELKDLILIKKLSYRKIGKIYGVSDTYIKKVAKNLGINLPIRANFSKNHNKKEKPKCEKCGNDFKITTWTKQRFCSKKCAAEFKSEKHYQYYLSHQDEFSGIKTMRFAKKFILLEQKNKCILCNIKNIWNGKLLIFILDHIDGNASNNQRKNLRLICPNCDSQLDTYKSKNKNSARKERYLLNYKT